MPSLSTFFSGEFALNLAIFSVGLMFVVLALTNRESEVREQKVRDGTGERDRGETPKRAVVSAKKAVSASGRREEVVQTVHGRIHVVVQGPLPNHRLLVTYHDIFSNGDLSFGGFVQQLGFAEDLSTFTVVHIHAPHHHPADPAPNDAFRFPSTDELADTVQDVVEALKLGRFVAVGSGAGADVLARYAIKHSFQVSAFAAVDLKWAGDSVLARAHFSLIATASRALGHLPAYAIGWATDRAFSQHAATDQPYLVAAFRENLRARPLSAMLKFAEAYMARSAIPASDLLALKHVKVLVVTSSRMSLGHKAARELVKFLGVGNADYFEARGCGTAALEEHPHRFYKPIEFMRMMS